jgi:hypothetical protein
VVEKRYIPEGGEWLLVEAGTGRTTRIDAPPSPSPNGRRFVTTSVDLVAGHLPNRVRIYRMEASGPMLEWEIEPREWGARFSAWRDDGTLRLERVDLDWSTYEELISPLEVRREAGGWRLQSSPEHARNVLLSFLSALASQHYMEAARYYGGTYDHLRGWNPGIDPQDLPSLWRAGCEFNGLQCLGRAEVVRTERLSPTETRFHLRLFHASGEPFVQGPCCGETAATMPPRSEFAFTVRRVDSQFRVMDPPPYVP